ncbi:hypothetical protein JCM5350_003213 [Sporobolomyces pararoseus]
MSGLPLSLSGRDSRPMDALWARRSMQTRPESVKTPSRGTWKTATPMKQVETERENETEDWSWFQAQREYKDFHGVAWTQEEGTNAEDFCQACETLIRLAGFCTNDLATELKKIRNRTMEEKISTLEQVIAIERTQAKKTATDAIDWMLLVLNFGAEAYQANLRSEDKEELSILIKAAPSRRNFYPKLGSPTELVEKDFGNWLNGIEIVSGRIEEWKAKENRSDDQ